MDSKVDLHSEPQVQSEGDVNSAKGEVGKGGFKP